MIPDLEQLGFTRNEANVYCAVLKLGSASVQQIANATGLNRITVHSIVEKFESMQILMQSYEGKRRRISAAPPSRLSFLLKEEEEQVRRKQTSLGGIMPTLEDLYRKSQRGLQVQTFKGVRGYEQMCMDVLTSKTETLEYANIDALNTVIGSFVIAEYIPLKRKRRIRTKFLYLDSPYARDYIRKTYMDHPDASPMQAKFIAPGDTPMDTFFVIYDNKLMILTPSTMDGIIIEDKGVYASLLPFFYFAWNQAGVAMVNDAERTILEKNIG